MRARVTALYRHPLKGFTPEPLAHAALTAGGPFPFDRLYAVEDGPSGFDPDAPAHVSKMRFTVLAKLAEVAKVRTAYDDQTTVLHAEAPGFIPFEGRLDLERDRIAFADWLAFVLGDLVTGPLKVLPAPGRHRFMDHPKGDVSILNLASVRELSQRIGKDLDPLRFRANILVEGWAPWAEMAWTGRAMSVGGARAAVFKPIVRCAATEVDPVTAERDVETVKAIFDAYGHTFCGLYLNVTEGGGVALGDDVEVLA
ncbi:MAG: hypothetical protein JWP35_71 [Caulobacter sp.]|nr:hypothetical protein [Caulobacter sp.]